MVEGQRRADRRSGVTHAFEVVQRITTRSEAREEREVRTGVTRKMGWPIKRNQLPRRLVFHSCSALLIGTAGIRTPRLNTAMRIIEIVTGCLLREHETAVNTAVVSGSTGIRARMLAL